VRYTLEPSLLKSLTVNSAGNIFVSSEIISAIESYIFSSSPSEISTNIEYLKEAFNRQQNYERIKINYTIPLLEAYIVNYLPRNTLVSKLGLLCRSYHPQMLSIPAHLNILDLGSGTGAITLGLLDLFRRPELNHIKCDIYAIDSSKDSLAIQKKLVDNYGLNGSHHDYKQVDLTNPETYEDLLAKKPLFDFIFSANILSELEPQYRDNVLAIIRANLAEDGVCIIAESQNTPAKNACAYLSHNVNKYGLHIFYPCPPDINCINDQCWKWLHYSFQCANIHVGGTEFATNHDCNYFWRIIVKKKLSIYDYLKTNKKGLSWGITRHNYNTGWDEFCIKKEQFDGTIEPTLLDTWSHMIGTSDHDKSIPFQWNFTDGFSICSWRFNKKDN